MIKIAALVLLCASLALASENGTPEPYAYSYNDPLSTHGQAEQSDGQAVTGFYYVADPENGHQRRVDYVADHQGFRATVQSNHDQVVAAHSAGAHHGSPAAPLASTTVSHGSSAALSAAYPSYKVYSPYYNGYNNGAYYGYNGLNAGAYASGLYGAANTGLYAANNGLYGVANGVYGAHGGLYNGYNGLYNSAANGYNGAYNGAYYGANYGYGAASPYSSAYYALGDARYGSLVPTRSGLSSSSSSSSAASNALNAAVSTVNGAVVKPSQTAGVYYTYTGQPAIYGSYGSYASPLVYSAAVQPKLVRVSAVPSYAPVAVASSAAVGADVEAQKKKA